MKLKAGFIREDGMVFLRYSGNGVEQWGTPKQLEEKRRKNREYMAGYYKRDDVKARSAMRSKKYREEKRDAFYGKIKEWATKNPTRVSYNSGLTKARKKGGYVPLTDDEEKMMMDWYAWRNLLNRVHGRKEFHLDHILPFWAGGKHHPLNVCVTTKAYNLAKGQGMPIPQQEAYFG